MKLKSAYIGSFSNAVKWYKLISSQYFNEELLSIVPFGGEFSPVIPCKSKDVCGLRQSTNELENKHTRKLQYDANNLGTKASFVCLLLELEVSGFLLTLYF